MTYIDEFDALMTSLTKFMPINLTEIVLETFRDFFLPNSPLVNNVINGSIWSKYVIFGKNAHFVSFGGQNDGIGRNFGK